MNFSPIRLQTIADDHWHIVIDMPKGRGMVKTAYRVFNNYKSPNVSTTLTLFKPTEEQIKAIDATQYKPEPKAKSSEPSLFVAENGKKTEQIVCLSCGILTAAGKFCVDCGASMERTCPGCNMVTGASGKFCSECGYRL